MQPEVDFQIYIKLFPDCSISILGAIQYVLILNIWLHLQINTLLTSMATIQLQSGQVVMSE